MDRTPGRPAADALLDAMDYAFDRKSWHGPNLLGSLRGVTAATAAARVMGRKNIWEQVLHAAYWKHRVLKLLAGPRHGPLGRKGFNWPAPPPPSDAAWKQDLALLKELHAKLKAEVAALPPARLDRKTTWLVHGAAAHDVYHAGQIKLLRRLLAETVAPRGAMPPTGASPSEVAGPAKSKGGAAIDRRAARSDPPGGPPR